MTRLSTIELYAQAGFTAGEVAASSNLRTSVCNGTASAEDQLAYGPFAAKWDKFAELMAERDQADQLAASAPSPSRHDADPDGGLGSALRQHRDGQAGRTLTVVRPRMIAVSDGTGSLMDVPEQPEWPKFRGSAGSGGHRIIAAGLNSADKKR